MTNLENLNIDDFPNYKRFESTYHLHNNGIRYAVNAEGRCDWYTCTHNVYNSFDEPEREDDD